MAGFDELYLAWQALQNLQSLRKHMRDNAQGYLSALAIRTVAEIAAVMNQDANEYLRRLGWVANLSAINKTKLANGLAALSLAVADGNAAVTVLTNAAQAQADAPKTTNVEITTTANALLAAVPAMITLW